jgi:hypothetical protein
VPEETDSIETLHPLAKYGTWVGVEIAASGGTGVARAPSRMYRLLSA